MGWQKWRWKDIFRENKEEQTLPELHAVMTDVYQKLKNEEYSEAREFLLRAIDLR